MLQGLVGPGQAGPLLGVEGRAGHHDEVNVALALAPVPEGDAANDNANTLYYRQANNNVVIVSEPLDKDRSVWAAVPTNCMLIAPHGQPIELAPFLSAKQIAAE